VLIIRSNSINTASGIVFCVSDRRLGRLKGCSFSTCTPNGHLQRVLHLHTGRSLNREYYTCTPNGHLQRILHLHTGWSLNREYYTWTPNGHLQRILHLHTERSLTENTTPAHRLNWEYMYIYIYIYLLQLGCYPVAVVILHINKTWNWLLLDLRRESYMRRL